MHHIDDHYKATKTCITSDGLLTNCMENENEKILNKPAQHISTYKTCTKTTTENGSCVTASQNKDTDPDDTLTMIMVYIHK